MRLLLALIATTVPFVLLACRESLSGFGAGVRARANADELFTALAERHLDVVRSAKYDYGRTQISKGALSPSRVFDDSMAWTGASGPVRILETFGIVADGKYVMSSRRGVGAPAKPADGRHVITLSRLSDNQYRWDTAVDFALGNTRPDDIALVIARMLAAGEGHNERDVRAALASSAPRTSTVLGAGFSLDSLEPTLLADGTTAVTVRVGIHSEQLRPRFPALSEFMQKYVDPAKYHFVFSDRGDAFVDINARDRFVTIRLRTQNGHLVPLTGAPRPMPDTLVLLADFTVKVKIFTIGFHELAMDFVNGARGDREHSWSVNARKEPKWNLPLITARLIRAPLRYPFAGEGALFRIGTREGGGDAPTVLFRQTRLAVQESAILKFLNSLTSTAMDDFGARVERDENIWLREIFTAMRDDARTVLGP
jgi:hypothetical protein